MSQDTDNPYLIGPNENTSAVMAIEKLKINNYQTWSIQMERLLDTKNKFDFVDETLPRLEDTDKRANSWRRCNKLVVG